MKEKLKNLKAVLADGPISKTRNNRVKEQELIQNH